jgi:hypothetical protein
MGAKSPTTSMTEIVLQSDTAVYAGKQKALSVAVDGLYQVFWSKPRWLRDYLQRDCDKGLRRILEQQGRALSCKQLSDLKGRFFYAYDDNIRREAIRLCIPRMCELAAHEPPYSIRVIRQDDLMESQYDLNGTLLHGWSWRCTPTMYAESKNDFTYPLELTIDDFMEKFFDVGFEEGSEHRSATLAWAEAWADACIHYPATAGRDFDSIPESRVIDSSLTFCCGANLSVGRILASWQSAKGVSPVRQLIHFVNRHVKEVTNHGEFCLATEHGADASNELSVWFNGPGPDAILNQCPAQERAVYSRQLSVAAEQLSWMRARLSQTFG